MAEINLKELSDEQVRKVAEEALWAIRRAVILSNDWQMRVLHQVGALLIEEIKENTDAAQEIAGELFEHGGKCPECQGHGGTETRSVRTGNGWNGMAAYELDESPCPCPVCGQEGE